MCPTGSRHSIVVVDVVAQSPHASSCTHFSASVAAVSVAAAAAGGRADIELYIDAATDFAPVFHCTHTHTTLPGDPVDNAYIKLACHSRLTAEMSRRFQ